MHVGSTPASVAQLAKSKLLPSAYLVYKATPISIALAFGQQSFASKVDATVGSWPSGSTVFPSHALCRSAGC